MRRIGRIRQARRIGSRSKMQASVARSTSIARNVITNGSTAFHVPNGSVARRNRSTIGVIATRMIWKTQILGKLNQPSARSVQVKTARVFQSLTARDERAQVADLRVT